MSLPATIGETETHFADGSIKHICFTCGKQRGVTCQIKRKVGIDHCIPWIPEKLCKTNSFQSNGVELK